MQSTVKNVSILFQRLSLVKMTCDSNI